MGEKRRPVPLRMHEETELRKMLEARSRDQNAVWRQRSRIVGRIFLLLVVAVAAVFILTPDLRRAVVDIFHPLPEEAAKAPGPGEDPSAEALQAVLQKISGQTPPANGVGIQPAPGSNTKAPAQTDKPAALMDSGDARMIRDVMDFLKPGGNKESGQTKSSGDKQP